MLPTHYTCFMIHSMKSLQRKKSFTYLSGGKKKKKHYTTHKSPETF